MLGLLLPNLIFIFAQAPLEKLKTLEEVKEMSYQASDVAEKEMPGILEQIWREEVIPTWRGMWQWLKNIWNIHIMPRVEALWQAIKELLGKEVEKRKTIIEEELQKEKELLGKEAEEIRREAPEVGRSLWERFRELIR